MAGRVARGAGNVVLTLAAIGGAVCIALVVLAVVFDITLILFKTGSMSPTIPAGSLAVVRQVPAEQVRVGDVVTVARDGALPITHRVTSTTPVNDGLVSLTMRGDANANDDPAPYLVSSVRLVLFSVPHLAAAVQWASQPLALGAVTIGASALVTWAFWPKDAPPARGRGAAHRLRGVRHRALALVLVALAASVVTPPAAAEAAETEEVIRGTHLLLTSIADRDAMADLQAGVPVDWQVGVSSDTTDAGTVHIELTASGGLMDATTGLQVTVRVCAVRWVAGECARGERLIAGPGAASTLLASPLAIDTMPTTQQRWVLVRGEVDSALSPGQAVLTVVASAEGETVTTGGTTGVLPRTGAEVLPAVLTALAAVAGGLALALLARRIRRHPA